MSPTKVVVATLACALPLGAPAAAADTPTYGCALHDVRPNAVTSTYEGVAQGFVVHRGDATATIRCYVTVDRIEVSSTPKSIGVTAGPVSFTAEDTSWVDLCGEVTSTHGTIQDCFPGTRPVPFPPAIVHDTLDDAVGAVNVAACPVLAGLAGDYAGLVVVTGDGDVDLAGEPRWDCPPYENGSLR